ncbi:MAG: hypothetical protein KIT11_03340 [Fimbriimonadaceae bacterium]|nr:hypothetical protein [Fimbriimonadaceae bacterium]
MALVLANPAARGQEKEIAPRPTASVGAAPVTRGEAHVVLSRFDRAASKVLGLEAPPMVKVAEPDKPITRGEIIKLLREKLDRFRPKFVVTPRPSPIDRKALESRNKPNVRQDLEPLLRSGFVAPVGPVVVGPAETLTVDEFADLVGFFFSRLADLTHKPSAQFSPEIMKGG